MIKNTLLLAVMASLVSFAACKKDDKKATESAKTAEPAAEEAKTEEKPAEPEGDKAAEVPQEERVIQVAEQVLQLYKKMSDTIKVAEGDCAKIATELTPLMKDFNELKNQMEPLDDDPDLQANEELMGKLRALHEESREVLDTMMGATLGESGELGECKTDEAVKKLFDAM